LSWKHLKHDIERLAKQGVKLQNAQAAHTATLETFKYRLNLQLQATDNCQNLKTHEKNKNTSKSLKEMAAQYN
jgi:hypothetical protein